MQKYDVIVIGGGTSGVAAAYMCAKLGIKTLLVEKNIHLGGTITSGLVIPAMKTNDLGINTEFYNDLVEYAKKYNAQLTYSDGNSGWFNPEILKIVLDDMLESVGCETLLNTQFKSVSIGKNSNFESEFISNMLSLYFCSNYIVDATGDGIVSRTFGCEVLLESNSCQATTMRFTMSNVDVNAFCNWIMKLDTNREVTTCNEIDSFMHLSTAYTWNPNQNWALRPIFIDAIANGDLEEDDSAYFQLFTVPQMPSAITFNCPRIILEECPDIKHPANITLALKKGRKQIYRISNFCKKYIKGFENATISNIADMLGVRESYRIEGKYVYTAEDIVNKTEFDNIALSSDYPIDIHSQTKNGDKLEFVKGNYFLPIESLISKKCDNLFIIGRCLSATFEAQAALRIQPSCFSMGEAVAKYIKTKLN